MTVFQNSLGRWVFHDGNEYQYFDSEQEARIAMAVSTVSEQPLEDDAHGADASLCGGAGMSEQQRIDCPVRLVERLRPAQEQIDKLAGEVQAALFGARLALDVPDDWVWDGSGWIAPETGSAVTPLWRRSEVR